MSNPFRDRNVSTLVVNVGRTVSGVLESPAAFGVSEEECEALRALNDELASLARAAALAEQAKLAAFDARNDMKAQVLTAIGNLTKKIYATTSVSDEMLLSVGLQERPGYKHRKPIAPTDLIASPYADGQVKLRWNRNGNAPNVTFLLEVSEGREWTMLGAFTSSRLTLNGFAPGEHRRFRVTASRNGVNSSPSNEAVIYPRQAIMDQAA